MKKKKITSIFKNGILGKYFNKQSPIWIDFRITYRCNLKCSYCGMWNQKYKEMTTDEVKIAIDKINDPGRVVLLTGGEPLVRKDIGEIVDYFAFNSNLYTRLNTNLLFLEKKYTSVQNCDGFYFSLDGKKRLMKQIRERVRGKVWNPV